MAGYVEILVDQGSTFNNIIYLTDDATNAPINAYGYTANSQIRRSYYSANISGNITCVFSNTANGEISMSMSAAATANLKAGRYLFDIKTTSPVGTVNRIIEGTLTILPQITR